MSQVTKQRITKEQLNELTAGSKKKLGDWCHERKYGKKEIEDGKEVFYDLITIGQMIEFIKDYWGPENTAMGIYELPEKWGVKLYLVKNRKMNEGKYTGMELELCDALWSTIRLLLDNK